MPVMRKSTVLQDIREIVEKTGEYAGTKSGPDGLPVRKEGAGGKRLCSCLAVSGGFARAA